MIDENQVFSDVQELMEILSKIGSKFREYQEMGELEKFRSYSRECMRRDGFSERDCNIADALIDELAIIEMEK